MSDTATEDEIDNNPMMRARSWTTAWSGANDRAGALGPPLILSKMLELRRKVGGIAAQRSTEAYGPKFPVKSSKELFQKLAQACNDLGLLAPVVSQTAHHFEYRYADKDGGERVGTGIHVTATVRVIAEDGSFLDLVGSGHGMDRDDKAGGKASTYAWKDALLKGLTIPEKDLMDTDDEEGQGEVRRPRSAPTASKGPPVEPYTLERALTDISAQTTEAGLKALRDARLKGLSEADQIAASGAYKERLTTVIRGAVAPYAIPYG